MLTTLERDTFLAHMHIWRHVSFFASISQCEAFSILCYKLKKCISGSRVSFSSRTSACLSSLPSRHISEKTSCWTSWGETEFTTPFNLYSCINAYRLGDEASLNATQDHQAHSRFNRFPKIDRLPELKRTGVRNSFSCGSADNATSMRGSMTTLHIQIAQVH